MCGAGHLNSLMPFLIVLNVPDSSSSRCMVAAVSWSTSDSGTVMCDSSSGTSTLPEDTDDAAVTLEVAVAAVAAVAADARTTAPSANCGLSDGAGKLRAVVSCTTAMMSAIVC